MDPCSFVRIIVGNLAVRFPSSSSEPSVSAPHCYCKIRFNSFPRHIVSAPVIFQTESESDTRSSTVAACFSLNKAQIDASLTKTKLTVLSVETYSRSDGVTGASCGLASASEKLLGRFEVRLDLKAAETKTCVAHNGWVALGPKKGRNKTGSVPELHFTVRVEPDPRFVFQFDSEPECSPQVFQVQGNTRQAVFTCEFAARISSESISSRSRVSSEKEQPSKERKGWSVTVHDLSGSPVAMASMVTPFVPSSPGSNRVTRSSPGAWLILRPDGRCRTWKPWGRLEAWREAGYSDTLGYRFELFQDGVAAEVSTSSSVSLKNGGSFVIDVTGGTSTVVSTPSTSPQGSCDLGSGSSIGSGGGSGSGSDFGYLLPQHPAQKRGLVMSASVEGVGKRSKPEVEVGVTHVTCTEDAAAHVALAAAVDLSLDACKLFSHKLRKELRQQSQLGVV